jgi:ubiquitin carboxyl-terminal hydrolase 36/42
VEAMEDPDVKFTCEGCKTQVMKMDKQLKLHKPPQVLALHLKRFKNDGVSIEKIDKFVEYPIELDLSPFLSSTENVSSFFFIPFCNFNCHCTKAQNSRECL